MQHQRFSKQDLHRNWRLYRRVTADANAALALAIATVDADRQQVSAMSKPCMAVIRRRTLIVGGSGRTVDGHVVSAVANGVFIDERSPLCSSVPTPKSDSPQAAFANTDGVNYAVASSPDAIMVGPQVHVEWSSVSMTVGKASTMSEIAEYPDWVVVDDSTMMIAGGGARNTNGEVVGAYSGGVNIGGSSI